MNGKEETVQQISHELAAMNEKLNELEQRSAAPKYSAHGRVWAVVAVCLVLGVICILSVILKSWFGEPKAIDWGIAILGVVLAGLSLFKTFEVTRDGLKIEMADLQILHKLVNSAASLMMRW